MEKASFGPRIVRPAKNGKTQIIRSTARWSDEAEERFLSVLAKTCNVKAAAKAAGFSTVTLYKRRARWPGFAAEWDVAVAQGYARLEARLVELANDSLRKRRDGDDDDDDDDDEAERAEAGPAMTVSETMNLLRLHRASVRGGAPQDYAWRRGAPDPEAMRASILRKIEAIERAERQATRLPSPKMAGGLVPEADPMPTEAAACPEGALPGAGGLPANRSAGDPAASDVPA